MLVELGSAVKWVPAELAGVRALTAWMEQLLTDAQKPHLMGSCIAAIHHILEENAGGTRPLRWAGGKREPRCNRTRPSPGCRRAPPWGIGGASARFG
jgi:hypothetical protein